MEKEEPKPIIEINDVKKNFRVDDGVVEALRGVSLSVFPGEFIVIFGPSGCGKSTLLNTILGIEKPTDGVVWMDNISIYNIDDDQRARNRCKKMGMVHQQPYWIKSLNVLENVAVPLAIAGVKREAALKKSVESLSELGIDNYAYKKPSQLSGGEQQKIGLARAIITMPEIILADEPTGNLDTTSSDQIIAVFDSLNRRHGRTIILVTHNPSYWDVGTRRIEMRDGKIVIDSDHH